MGVLMLVRHGQASFGGEDYDVLSSRGVRQSRKVAEALSGYGVAPTSLIHGGMRRQRETAEEMLLGAAAWELPLELDEGWRELDHLAVMAAYPTLSDLDRELLRTGRMELRAVPRALHEGHRSVGLRCLRLRLPGVLRRVHRPGARQHRSRGAEGRRTADRRRRHLRWPDRRGLRDADRGG